LTRLPAEWEPHDAIMLTWPHKHSDWQPILEEVTEVYLELIHLLWPTVKVIIAAAPGSETALNALLQQQIPTGYASGSIRVYGIDSDDTWARDHGPITIREDDRWVILDFEFNGWGGKFSAGKDNKITQTLHKLGAFGENQRRQIDQILEGGALESNGAGCLLTTSACLLNNNRSDTPTLDKEARKHQVEQDLEAHLGASKILWLNHGFLSGDDTDSHIDTLARFASPRTITYIKCDDPTDEHFDALAAMESELLTFSDQNDEPFELVSLPWPSAKYSKTHERLPATYANYLITNGIVIVPTYQDPQDSVAIATLSRTFPNRKVIGIDCTPLIQQHGSLHCITMQIPRGALT